jgi:putative Mn2+ efflux pump MntP
VSPSPTEARIRAANVRTALVLASIALVFFGGVIAAKFMGGWTTGMAIVGGAVLIFLAFAIGRNLRRGR